MSQNFSRILITGSGGREHCIGWKLMQDNPHVSLFFAPGNAGTAQLGTNIEASNIDAIVATAKSYQIDLTIVGSEDLLAEGITDRFVAEGLRIFGPHQKAAQLESSKTFAKDFMRRHGIKTAAYANFTDYEAAQTYLDQQPMPIVIKAGGLAAGKGVMIAHEREEANQALRSIMLDRAFGEAGDDVVIEEYLEGFEASILSICTGNEIISWCSAMDHKQAYDQDVGPNTGGMGVVAPHPFWSESLQAAYEQDIVQPTARGLEADGLGFSGVIFFGLMITHRGVYLLEYNLRLGDPETQAILPLLDTSLSDILANSLAGQSTHPKWRSGASCALVIAAEGYPGSYIKGTPLDHLNKIDCPTFLAGVTQEQNGSRLVTSGGRILSIVGRGDTLESARDIAYHGAKELALPHSFYRHDIGLRRNPLATDEPANPHLESTEINTGV